MPKKIRYDNKHKNSGENLRSCEITRKISLYTKATKQLI